MVTAAWDTSNLVALFNNGLQCTSCCFEGYEPGICCPGFGENATPSQYTAFIIGVQDCPVAGASILNGLWQLPITGCTEGGEEPDCHWVLQNASVWIAFNRAHVGGGCAQFSFFANWWDGSNWKAGFADNLSFTQATGRCMTFDNTFVNCTSPRFGKFGTAKVWPLSWVQWSIVETYQTNDRVFNDGEIYDCILGHVANADREPGTGVDWETYWAVGDPCGDANVVCP